MEKKVKRLKPTRTKRGAPAKEKKQDSLGYRVHTLRVSMGLTMEQFCKRCKMSMSSLYAIENSKRESNCKLDTLKKIADCCNVSIEFLILGK